MLILRVIDSWNYLGLAGLLYQALFIGKIHVLNCNYVLEELVIVHHPYGLIVPKLVPRIMALRTICFQLVGQMIST